MDTNTTLLLLTSVTAIGALATAVFTGFLWWVGRDGLIGARKELGLVAEQARLVGEQVELTRKQHEREVRPYVAASALPGLWGPGSWDLMVRNFGRTAARNVRFAIDPWPARVHEDLGDHEDGVLLHLLEFLDGSYTIVPDAHYRVMWRLEAGFMGGPNPVEGAPEDTKITVHYQDDLGNVYEDAFPLTLAGSATPSPDQGMKATSGSNQELANINHALRAMNVHLGELRR